MSATTLPNANLTPEPAAPARVAVRLLGREYMVACGPGEEPKLYEIVNLVESKLRDVADKGGNASEARLFLLTCLLLADELLETKRLQSESQREDEDLMVAAVEHLRQRIAALAQQMGRA